MSYACYLCLKEIAIEDAGSKNKTTHGVNIKPLENYRSVDVFLTDGEYTVAYATPVCSNCLKFILDDKSYWQELMDGLIAMIEKHHPHPEFDDLKKSGNPIFVSTVNDLTETLIKDGVIQCP